MYDTIFINKHSVAKSRVVSCMYFFLLAKYQTAKDILDSIEKIVLFNPKNYLNQSEIKFFKEIQKSMDRSTYLKSCMHN